MAPCELARTEPASPSSHCPHLKGLRKKVISPVGAAKHLTEEITLMYESLAHTKYMCKYHVVFIPKYRKKIIFKDIRPWLVQRFKELAAQKGCRIEAGSILPDHVHMVISIPPKYSVSAVIGYIKGKSAIAIARDFGRRQKNFMGEHFWARGYFVSTVGMDEEAIKHYVENQTLEDIRLEKLKR